VGSPVTQDFTLTVDSGPAFTGSDSTVFTVGQSDRFTVTTSGFSHPTPALSASGPLPAGVTFTDNGDGTAALSGTADTGTGGVYPLTLTADNGVGSPVTEDFTLTVDEATALTSGAAATFIAGHAGTFTVEASGFPSPMLSVSGDLPGGVGFTDNGDGTATLSGTPDAGTGGSYPLTITADNNVGSPATQDFTLTVNEAPAIVSGDTATFTAGQAGSFTIDVAGFPTPTLGESGTLPTGLTFVDNGDGTATMAGTPTRSGRFTLHITATNTLGTATQNLSVTVGRTPTLKVKPSRSAKVGRSVHVAVKATGFPSPTITVTGTLPDGVTFADRRPGRGLLSGTPAAGSQGSYTLTFTATNGVGHSSKQMVLRVRQ
jgi:hypothetical protein